MRIFVDCMPLSLGGGVQVALAFLSQLSQDAAIEWRAVAPRTLEGVCARVIGLDPRLVFLPKCSPGDILRASASLPWMERAFGPDVVFTVFGPAYFKARAPHVMGFALPNLIYDRPHHLRRHGMGFATLFDALRRRLLLVGADHFIAETQIVGERMTARLGIPAEKISIVANAVNPALAEIAAKPARWEPPYVVLTPSAHYPHKNLEILPAVAARLKALAPDLAFEFRLTLPPDDAPFQAIGRHAQALGVAQHVRTLGAVEFSALIQAYRAAHVVMLPTSREASTAVYPETFHFQRPLITSDADFAHDLCGDAALFVAPLDADALAHAVLRVLGDPALRDRLVAAGTARLKTAYPSPAEKYAQQLAVLRAVARPDARMPRNTANRGGP